MMRNQIQSYLEKTNPRLVRRRFYRTVMVLLVTALALSVDWGVSHEVPLSAATPSPTLFVPTQSVTMGTSTSLLGVNVKSQDFSLVAPDAGGGAINGPVFAYTSQFHNAPGIMYLPQNTEIPMFVPWDRDDPLWWDEMVDELLFARTPFVLLHGRGCFDMKNSANTRGSGNMCPRILSKMVDAVTRAGAQDVMRFGMFIDTGAMPGARQTALNAPAPQPMDLTSVADTAGHAPLWYFWDADIQIWFDTVPRNLWYLYDDNGTKKPVIALWSLADAFFSHQKDNARLLLEQIRSNFQARYGMTPFFNLDRTWLEKDPSLVNDPGLVSAINGWMGWNDPGYTTKSFLGKTWGALVPGGVPGKPPNGNSPDCGAACGEIPRNHGTTFTQGFLANRDATMNIVEGFTDVAESSGSYRSDDSHWDWPNQYLDILRQYSDPSLGSLRFQAETADDYFNALNKPATTFRYNKALGIIPLGSADQGVGWALASTTPGEAFDYRNVVFPAALYKFTARVASPVDGNRLHFSIDMTDLPTVPVPNTGDAQTYVVVDLGTVPMSAGPHTLKLTLDTGGVNVDWFFAKRQ